MSSADPGHELHGVPEELRTFAEFDLEPMVDGEECPTEVTVFDGDAGVDALKTHWITMDRKNVWPLEDCR